MSGLGDCRILDLRRFEDRRGNLTPVEHPGDLPFEIARVYYLYDVPGGVERGGHAHRRLEQLIVSAMGSFNVVLDDGRSRKTVFLNRAYRGLYMPPGIWREIADFSSGGVCLVLASLPYDEADYIRDYGEFKAFKQAGKQG